MTKYVDESMILSQSIVTQSPNKLFKSQVKRPESQIYFKKGKILKKGDGPINWDWGDRYAVLDGVNFSYYTPEDQEKPKRILNIVGSSVEKLEDPDVEYGIVLTPVDGSKPINMAGASENDNEEWFNILVAASQQKSVNFFDLNLIPEGEEEILAMIPKNVLKEAKETKETVGGNDLKILAIEDGIRIFGGRDREYEDLKVAIREEKEKLTMDKILGNKSKNFG
jgi:hypothetical protein